MSLALKMLLQRIPVLTPFLATDEVNQALYPYLVILRSNLYQYSNY